MYPNHSRPKVQVIDLGVGNVGSICKMMSAIGARPQVVSSGRDLDEGGTAILPGVGNFGAGATALDDREFRQAVLARHRRGAPTLGICLGAQLLCTQSEEAEGTGLGLVPSTVRRFPPKDPDGRAVTIPHVGWRSFAPGDGVLPFAVPPGRMYFTHSYYIDATASPSATPCSASYGGCRFATVVRSAPSTLGFQFHPEKSHRFGLALLSNWLKWATHANGT